MFRSQQSTDQKFPLLLQKNPPKRHTENKNIENENSIAKFGSITYFQTFFVVKLQTELWNILLN